MNKIAVFGNAGSGKSTTSRQLAQQLQLPLYVFDKIQFGYHGEAIEHQEYLKQHSDILTRQQWVIDGFGCLDTLWPRLKAADTLVYIDLPLYQHILWVTKRYLTGLVNPPKGWPKGAPLLKSTIKSYQVLWLCHRKLAPHYRQFVANKAKEKTIFHLRSKKELNYFISSLSLAKGLKNT